MSFLTAFRSFKNNRQFKQTNVCFDRFTVILEKHDYDQKNRIKFRPSVSFGRFVLQQRLSAQNRSMSNLMRQSADTG